ncbi:hypothetical protein GTO89_01225 [Heliobacterium gestii]|uniref:Uncharacterized protein n=1 Tax=Heliomicrobium gestii TaxID=2699 RepID=A0A845L7U4_HELGE|nr:hypothetical protein [Heliomicrobium gestii]MBM7865391.1 tetratricopeptide (TPR) repeat protein [Heliomicrobium gestii]MZP41651.1 hypothetical protein [Heliomicrobium gestii]
MKKYTLEEKIGLSRIMNSFIKKIDKIMHHIWEGIKYPLLYLSVVAAILFAFYSGYWLYNYHSPQTPKYIYLNVEGVTQYQVKEKYQEYMVHYIKEDEMKELIDVLKKIETLQNEKVENFLTVSNLNAFYSSLFAAVAVFVGIIGVTTWNTIRELKKQTERYKEIENKIVELYSRKEFTKTARDIIEENEDVKSSFKLNLTDEQRNKLIKFKNTIMKDSDEIPWMEILVAHYLLTENPTKKDIENAEKIFLKIEKEYPFQSNSLVEPYLYHMLGQLFKVKYDKNKEYDGKEEFLEKSAQYYKKSLKLRDSEENAQTKSNLAVVLIELAKIKLYKKSEIEADEKSEEEAHKYLDLAESYLNDAAKQLDSDYNIPWDLARIEYYKNYNSYSDKVKTKVEALLKEAVSRLIYYKDKVFFMRKLKEEQLEMSGRGFPKDMEIIEHVKKEIGSMNLRD